MISKWVDSFTRQILTYWKWCLSFSKPDWNLGDYPVLVRTQQADPAPLNSRFKQGRYMAYVVNWHIAGIGDSYEEAIADLGGKFEAAKAERQRKGDLLPRPGSRVPTEFASQDRASNHPELADDFTRRILGLDWAWISDESSLWHFHADETNEVVYAKIKEAYGVDVSDIESARLSEILERIATTRTSAPTSVDRPSRSD